MTAKNSVGLFRRMAQALGMGAFLVSCNDTPTQPVRDEPTATFAAGGSGNPKPTSPAPLLGWERIVGTPVVFTYEEAAVGLRQKTATATCPAGKKVLSGGYSMRSFIQSTGQTMEYSFGLILS